MNNDYNRFDLKGTLWWLLRFTVCLGLIFFGLAACNTLSNQPSQGWASPPYPSLALSNALMHPARPAAPMPQLTLRTLAVAIQPTNGMICLTNPQTGATRCFTPKPPVTYDPTLATLRWFIPVPSNGTVWPTWKIEYTHDFKTWTPVVGIGTNVNAFKQPGWITEVVKVSSQETGFRMASTN